MSTNQQYSTRLGMRKNLRAVMTRLHLDSEAFRKISELYAPEHPEIAKAAKQLNEIVTILATETENLRANM